MKKESKQTNFVSQSYSGCKGGGSFLNDEAKTMYNNLMIKNYILQQAINAYARDYRIKNQSKMEY